LPDSFVERVKTLEINYDNLLKEPNNLLEDYNKKPMKVETKRSLATNRRPYDARAFYGIFLISFQPIQR
jgi:hypothetical protein